MFRKPRKLKDPSSFPKGYEYALFLLSLRQYSQKEIHDKMKTRGYNGEVIAQVITELIKLRYISDERMAESLLQSYIQYRTYGYYGIKQKMMLKKIPTDQIERALSTVSIEDELEIARRYLEKESRIAKKIADPKLRKQKLAQKLKARGFRSEVVQKLF